MDWCPDIISPIRNSNDKIVSLKSLRSDVRVLQVSTKIRRNNLVIFATPVDGYRYVIQRKLLEIKIKSTEINDLSRSERQEHGTKEERFRVYYQRNEKKKKDTRTHASASKHSKADQ